MKCYCLKGSIGNDCNDPTTNTINNNQKWQTSNNNHKSKGLCLNNVFVRFKTVQLMQFHYLFSIRGLQLWNLLTPNRFWLRHFFYTSHTTRINTTCTTKDGGNTLPMRFVNLTNIQFREKKIEIKFKTPFWTIEINRVTTFFFTILDPRFDEADRLMKRTISRSG